MVICNARIVSKIVSFLSSFPFLKVISGLHKVKHVITWSALVSMIIICRLDYVELSSSTSKNLQLLRPAISVLYFKV